MQDNSPEKSVKEQLEKATRMLLEMLPEGTPIGDAFRKYTANTQFSDTMVRLASPGGDANTPLKAKDLEALRVAIRTAKEAISEFAVYMPLTPPNTEMLPPVLVRLRCPVTRELIGPEISLPIGELETVVQLAISVECPTCATQHNLADENAVIVPSPGQKE